MKQCNHCGQQFADTLQACPFCGQPANYSYQTGQQPQYGQQHQPMQPQYAYGPQNAGNDIGLFDSGPSGKSRGTAGLLALLLGGFGIHYFYCGKATGGLICFLLACITCGLWCVLTFIQGIMIMCMKQDEFECKFVYSSSSFPLF